MALYALISLICGQVVPGWTSILVSIWIIGGVQLIAAAVTVWAAVSLSKGREPMRLKPREKKAVHSDEGGEKARRDGQC